MVSNSDQAGSGNFDTFMANNVHPAYAEAGPSGDDAPPRETVTAADLHHDPAAPPGVNAEVHGAMHRPTDTRKYPSAALGQVGFPQNWRQAANPNQQAEWTVARTPVLDARAQEAVYASYQAGVGTQEELAGVFHVSRYVIQRIVGKGQDATKENNDGDK
jgi:hypothetical protein